MASEKIFGSLNEEQRRAVESVRGPVCILAGAGSGKTTTITHRIAYQVASGTFRAEEILAVTFTDKAAGEMRTRLQGLGVEGVNARTFHSAALAQLRHLSPEEPPQILNSKVPVVRQIMNSLPKPYRFRQAGDLATEIEWAKNRRIRPDDYEDSGKGHTPPIPRDLMAGVYRRYEQIKSDQGRIDFEDMLEHAIQLFQSDEWARDRFASRYHAFTVDEYQDVNLLQETLLREWVGANDNLCVVGDDYQSIYGFTGASPSYLLDMPIRFPTAKVIRLEDNYRSTPEILEVANRLVPKLGGAEKVLRPTRETGSRPLIRRFTRPDAESKFIVARIRELHEQGLPYEHMAILYRVNFRSEDFEELLAAEGIPYQVRDGSFLNRATARQMNAALKKKLTTDVAGTVRDAALRSGYLEDLPAGLGDQELTRQKDLQRFIQLAEEFDDGRRTTADFIADVGQRFQPDGLGRGVNLLTLHRAKGLEFEAVFLPRLEDGELPFRRSRSDEDVAEERRLFYVGITRAKAHLAISWVHEGRRKGSPFVKELIDNKKPRGAAAKKATSPPDTLAARIGLEVKMSGGFSGEIVNLEPDGALVALSAGGDLFVSFGERVTAGDATLELGPPVTPSDDTDHEKLLTALKEWRKQRAKDDEVPAYIVFHDSCLQEIAERKPTDLAELGDISGVGPTKLDRYGTDVLRVLEKAT